VSAAMAAAIAAVLLAPLNERISAWAEERFERDLALLKKQLPELVAELSAGSSTRKLAAAVLPRIRVAIHATRAALVVDGAVVAALGAQPRQVLGWLSRTTIGATGTQFQIDPSDRLFPSRMEMRCPFGTVRGWLLLGPRPDGSRYGKHELAALATIAPALRQGLFAAKNRDDERSREQRLLRTISRKVDSLAKRVEGLAASRTLAAE